MLGPDKEFFDPRTEIVRASGNPKISVEKDREKISGLQPHLGEGL